jgi:uncharacterized protein
MKTTKAQIEDFLAQPHIALAGYSRNSRKFGGTMFKSLREKGYNIYPVNPAGGKTPEGENIYESLEKLPEYVKALIVVTRPDVSAKVIKEAMEQHFTHIWVQQMSENKQVMELLTSFPQKVTGECVMMYAHPHGIHKFHWWLAKLIGKLPV